MNPLSSSKYLRRSLMALAATMSIVFAVNCGSGSGFTPPNQVGFTNSSLNGTYVFTSSGTDSQDAYFTIAGAIVANGNGGITGGTVDVTGINFPPSSLPVTGSYKVLSDGRGQFNVKSSAGTLNFAFVLSSPSHGTVSEFDNNGAGSGTIDLQTVVPSLAQLAGPYAFSLAGVDAGDNPLASAGAFTLNSTGTTTAGVQDFNDNGIPFTNRPLAGVVTAASGTTPGLFTLTTSIFGALTFDYYPIDATHFKLIETDFSSIMAGEGFTQIGAAIPHGPMVFTMSGGSATTVPVAAGGLMSSDGAGNFTGLEDVNQVGTVPPQLAFTGTAAPGGSVGGRVVVNLSGFVPATQWVIYPSSGGLLMLETDPSNVTLGSGFAQTATSFPAMQDYGLNLTGQNPNGEVDYIAQFTAGAATSSPNMTGLLDDNEFGFPPVSGLNFSGTYTPDSPATGRGFILVPTLGTANGGLGLQYYVVNGSTSLFVELDPQQVAVGSFSQQNSTGSMALMRPVLAVAGPTAKSRGAVRKK